ncbi:hypothetical protein [Falsirhodobacter deserti]|uniref:hypothetical protein n=1 Tax=Falsirhodobacter deserti TaxID=1365611 RepID=UPI000FE33769|nr:hypothetical protein [Falsirhodobacter deserti]
MKTPTTDRLRSDIDSGRSGDKVNFSDPAMSPLGTDDEAAGTPNTPEQIRMAAQHETTRGDDPSAGRKDRNPELRQRDKGRFLFAIAGIILLALILAWIFGAMGNG